MEPGEVSISPKGASLRLPSGNQTWPGNSPIYFEVPMKTLMWNGGFLKWGYPQFSSIYRWIFHEISQPASGVPLFVETPIFLWFLTTFITSVPLPNPSFRAHSGDLPAVKAPHQQLGIVAALTNFEKERNLGINLEKLHIIH